MKRSAAKTTMVPLANAVMHKLLVSPRDAATVVDVIVEGTTFSVLKCLISSAFSVLNDGLADEDIVQVDGITAATFQTMLDFLCKSEDECPESRIEDLLRAAYRLGLREEFFDHLRANVRRKLNRENIMAIVKLAVIEKDDNLKDDCVEFIYHNLKTLISLPSWKMVSEIQNLHLDLLDIIFTSHWHLI
ncbi:Hypothetical protein NTJ_07824 [Nesidiocoris tenuis]|nr:Hypothetical protein NTJ_07824 [Nesidiocoris tenuis]